MQKFTRALTREIEVGGERLAVTLSEEGLSVRPVGSRRPPHELSWAACLSACVGQFSANPTEADLAEAVKKLKVGAPKAKEAESPPAPAAAAKPPAPAAPAPAPAAAALTANSAPAPAAPAHTPAPVYAPDPAHAPDHAHPSGGELPELLTRLDTWLAQHRQRFHKGLLPGATPEQCESLKKQIPCPLPEELRTLLSWHNGQDPDLVGGLEENWILLSSEEIADAKHELDEANADGWHKNWLPFVDDGQGNSLVLDTSRPGAPVFDCWQGRAQHDEIAPSLTAWMRNFVTAVEKGEYHEDSERGGFHRAKKS
jgi:cell wall assembly regulator SMI1